MTGTVMPFCCVGSSKMPASDIYKGGRKKDSQTENSISSSEPSSPLVVMAK